MYSCIEKPHIILQRNFRIIDTFYVEAWGLHRVRLHQRTELRMDNVKQRRLAKTWKIPEFAFSVRLFVWEELSRYDCMKFKVSLIFFHTKHTINISREIETNVKYLASPLCEKSFHKNLLLKENKKQKRNLTQEIYTCVTKSNIYQPPSNPSYNWVSQKKILEIVRECVNSPIINLTYETQLQIRGRREIFIGSKQT